MTRRLLPGLLSRPYRLCHFDPLTGEDQKHAPGAKEDCEAACYNCLMSYYNQMDHRLLGPADDQGFPHAVQPSSYHFIASNYIPRRTLSSIC